MSQDVRSWEMGGSGRLRAPGRRQLSREQPDAFGAFYERHVRTVLAHVRRQGLGVEEAERHPRIEGSVRGGGGGCWRAADLARRLDRKGVAWSGSSHGPERRTYNGYADGDVVSIRVVGEAAGAEVRMTKPWTPRTEGGEALRFFVVIDEHDIDVGGDGVQEDEIGLISTPIPTIEVTYADGSAEEIEAP